jgi:uncharacterized membrane protein HdeD (DUF308 family)
MNDTLMQSWSMLALQGVLAILFGVLALAWPQITLVVLVALFAAYALCSGALWLIGAVRKRQAKRPRLALAFPAVTVLVLVLLMGAQALVHGVFELVVALRLRKLIHNEWLLVLSAMVSLVFGLLVLLYPVDAGLTALVLLVSVYAMLAGALSLAAAWRLRAWSRLHAGRSSPAAGAT